MLWFLLPAASVVLAVQLHLDAPSKPDPKIWQVLPPADHELPQGLRPGREVIPGPGVTLWAQSPLLARGARGGRAGTTIKAALQVSSRDQLHLIFGAQDLHAPGARRGRMLSLAPGEDARILTLGSGGSQQQRCVVPGARIQAGRIQITLRVTRDRVHLALVSQGGESGGTCMIPAPEGDQVALLSPGPGVVLRLLEVSSAVGAPFRFSAERSLSGWLGSSAVILVLLLLVWLLDGALHGRLLRRDLVGGMTFSAMTALPLTLLPLALRFPPLDLTVALRLGKTAPEALSVGGVLALLLLVKAVALLVRSPALRAKDQGGGGAPTRKGRAAAGALLVHAVVLSGAVVVTGGGEIARTAGPWATTPLLGILTLVLGLVLPWSSVMLMGRLVPAAGRPRLLLLESLSWGPSLAVAALVLLGVPAGLASAWSLPFHLFCAATASLLFKLVFMQVNAKGARHVNWASLACVGLLLLGAEGAARTSYLNKAWAGALGGKFVADQFTGWTRARLEFDEIERLQRRTKYPIEGFPVSIPGHTPGKAARIVFLGGSTTGGAYQMDNLDQFYPAGVQRALDATAGHGRYQVINQGVGGWNTHHIQLYLKRFMDKLRPDIIVLYVGNNDFMSRESMTYRDFWRLYQAQGQTIRDTLQTLRRSRLFVGFQGLVGAGRRAQASQEVIAVPVAHARDNINAIFDLAQARGVKVVLLSEAIASKPQGFLAYRQMLQEVARERGGHYLDIHKRFADRPQVGLFIDDCHLTQAGHKLLATMLLESGLLHRPAP